VKPGRLVLSGLAYWQHGIAIEQRDEAIRQRNAALFAIALSDWPVTLRPHTTRFQVSASCYRRDWAWYFQNYQTEDYTQGEQFYTASS
jgi:hypothetical protein